MHDLKHDSLLRTRNASKLGKAHYLTLMVSVALLWLTGIAWLYVHMMMSAETEFGRTVNPLEPTLIAIHGFLIIPFLAGFGGILFHHVGNGWNRLPKRLSGISLLAFFALLTLSGFGLYYFGNEDLRVVVKYLHWGCGIAVPLPFLWHLAIRVRDKKTHSETEREAQSPGVFY